MAAKRINSRKLTSLFMVFGFSLMAITGLMLFFVPVGRNARWMEWSLIGLDKADWEHVHLLSSLLFIGAGLFHISNNWKAIISHFKSKIATGLRARRELAIAVVVTLFVLVSGLFELPPLSYVLELNGMAQDVWLTQPEYKPPFGRAERFSLGDFTHMERIDLSVALRKLRTHGIAVSDTSETLRTIAHNNETTPMELYKIIKQ